MKKCHRILMMTLFCLCYLSGFSQVFKFRQVHTDDVCLMQLMENITKVIHGSQWNCDARCHYLLISKIGSDTVLEIHSYDAPGIYKTLSDREGLPYAMCVRCQNLAPMPTFTKESKPAFSSNCPKNFLPTFTPKAVTLKAKRKSPELESLPSVPKMPRPKSTPE